MSSIVIKGNTSGQIELAAPDVAGSTTLTLPTGTGTVLLSDGDGSNLTGISSYADSDALSLFNAGGSAPVYACRAWVNFSMLGTWSIRGDGNISSVTDRGTGLGTVNFTTALPDANYAVCMGSYEYDVDSNLSQMNAGAYDLATTNFDFALSDSSGNAYKDPRHVYFSIFR